MLRIRPQITHLSTSCLILFKHASALSLAVVAQGNTGTPFLVHCFLQCKSNHNAMYNDENIFYMGQDPYIAAIDSRHPNEILAKCSLSTTNRCNSIVRLSDLMIYLDQHDTGVSHNYKIAHQLCPNAKRPTHIAPSFFLQIGCAHFIIKKHSPRPKCCNLVTRLPEVTFSQINSEVYTGTFLDYLTITWVIIIQAANFVLTTTCSAAANSFKHKLLTTPPQQHHPQ